MLVLTRKKDQKILIGDDIEVMVLGIQGDGVRIGITAPKSVKVFRKELLAEIQNENINAAKSVTHVQPSDLCGLLNLPTSPASMDAGDTESTAAHDDAVPPEIVSSDK